MFNQMVNANDTSEVWYKLCTDFSVDQVLVGAGSSALLTYHRTTTTSTSGFSVIWSSSTEKGNQMKAANYFS